MTIASGVPQPPGFFAPSLFGYTSSIMVPASLSGGDGLISNSMKLIGSAQGWIEVGYQMVGTTTLTCGPAGTWYFWTDASPNGIAMHCLGTVPQADAGHYAVVKIASLGNDLTQSSSFAVEILNQATNFTPCTKTAPCTNPLWNPGGPTFADVQLGQILVGSKNAFAPTTLFVNNTYEQPNGTFSFQTADGGVSADNPPFGGWVQTPSTPGGNGGAFFTECCLPPATVYPAQVDFGGVAVGSTSSAQTILLTNIDSSATLNITAVNVTGANSSDFTISSNPCGSSLAPLTGCKLSIVFKPTQQGSRTATLTVTDNGGSGSGSDSSTLVGQGN